MNFEEFANEFKCCTGAHDHFVERPKFLSCSHLICDKCALKDSKNIKCNRCHKINQLDLKNLPGENKSILVFVYKV